MTMQRLKRGDLTRINPRKAMHTDVYQPSPKVAAPVAAPSDDSAVKELQAQLASLKQEKRGLEEQLKIAEGSKRDAVAQAETEKQRAKVAEEKLKEAQEETPEQEPVNSVKVKEVARVRRRENTMRIDCTVDPTDGPLAEKVAIYLTVEEGEKIRLEEEEESDDTDG